MTKKELIDLLFKVFIIVIVLIFTFVYYNNAQINRYKYYKNDDGLPDIFDSYTGKLYRYSVIKGDSFWVIFTPLKTVEAKKVEIKRMEENKSIIGNGKSIFR